jgi:hypothetical protein
MYVKLDAPPPLPLPYLSYIMMKRAVGRMRPHTQLSSNLELAAILPFPLAIKHVTCRMVHEFHY